MPFPIPGDLPNPGIELMSLAAPALVCGFFTISSYPLPYASGQGWLLLMNALRDVSVCMLSCFSHAWLSATLSAITLQAPLSLEFSRQEYWNGLLVPTPGDLLDSRIKPTSLPSLALASRFFFFFFFFYHWATWEALINSHVMAFSTEIGGQMLISE